MMRTSLREVEVFKRELCLAPRQVRARFLERTEETLLHLEPGKSYPLDYLEYRITGHRIETSAPRALSTADAWMALCDVLEDVGRTLAVETGSLEEQVLSVEELAARWRIAPAQVMRLRAAGLPGRLFRFGQGRRRIGVRAALVERFESERAEHISRARCHRRPTNQERLAVIEAALVALAREESPSRIVEGLAGRFELRRPTVERMIASAARENPSLKALTRASISARESELIFDEMLAGAAAGDVAARYGRTEESVTAVYLRGRARRALRRRLKVIMSDEFLAADAHEAILDAAFARDARGAEGRAAASNDELPIYLKGSAGLPLLTREAETILFRRYNYLKYLARERRKDLDARRPDRALLDEVETLLRRADEARDSIVRSNLRLVMSIARRHFGRKTSFPALVSDGNMALLDAVESFDYSRGNRFSTYAGWAIMRRFARTIPEENYRITTLEQEALDVAARVEVDFGALKPAVLAAGVTRALAGLPERERIVLESRFGLGDRAKASTLAEIGALFGVTKERIRQIEIQALERLRRIVEATAPELMPE